MDFHVYCTEPSDDGALLAVGCHRAEDFEGGRDKLGMGTGERLLFWERLGSVELCWTAGGWRRWKVRYHDSAALKTFLKNGKVREFGQKPWMMEVVASWQACRGNRCKARLKVDMRTFSKSLQDISRCISMCFQPAKNYQMTHDLWGGFVTKSFF